MLVGITSILAYRLYSKEEINDFIDINYYYDNIGKTSNNFYSITALHSTIGKLRIYKKLL